MKEVRVMSFYSFNNIAAVIVRSFGLIAKFLLVICLVKYFNTSDLGLYGVVTAIVAYILFFLGLEYYNYSSRALVGVNSCEQVIMIRDQIVLHAIVYLIISPVIFLVFFIHLLPYLFCFLFLLLILFEQISNELMRILIVLSHPYLANIVYFFRQGFWIYILIPFFVFIPETRQIDAILVAWTIGAISSILIGVMPLIKFPWKNIWLHPVNWSNVKQGLYVSRPFLISAFCALGLLYIERFFIGYFCGMDELGIYTFYAGFTIALHNLVNTCVTKMRLAQLLIAYKQNNLNAFYLEVRDMLKNTIVFVFVFVMMSVICMYPFLIFINKKIYLHSLNVFYVLLFAVSCRSIADVPLYVLYAQNNDHLILKINLCSFFALILGEGVFIYHMGLMGAALASALASFILLGYSSLMMGRRISKPLIFLQQS